MQKEKKEHHEEYVSRAEAARILRVHPRTIDRYGESGRLSRFVRLGRIVYSREELEELDKAVPVGEAVLAGEYAAD